MSEQPEALRLADRLDMLSSLFVTYGPEKGERLCANAAIELRRQHAEIERLRNDLSNIKFQAELAREYIIQLNDDCDAAVKRGKP